MDRVVAQISQSLNWDYLIALECSLKARGVMTTKVQAALDHHSHALARRYLLKKGRLGLGPFSAAEEEILDVLADAVTALRRSGRLPHNIIKSLCVGGLIAAVQRSVAHVGLLRCRTDFESDVVLRTVFEAIINRHPTAFSAETVELAGLRPV
ncbi:hypothetical protein QE393_002048 [Pseudomonas sp. SORGH_AS 211]|uniref:hypothetical protein n=1 Tax=Pseudomonas sp. SORGH_AS_0211 TaxID=3041796 RepID=UPI00285ED6D8|nr:hypothetical protein [Pseudomonas sp. SORGH_AS_0211]MDR6178788.1 hypothetical protein [Pseudomonas sp. SORGH_AS_0211]